MKRFVTLICIVLTTLAGWAQNNKIVNRTEGSITFTVDENLAPISENALTIEEFMTDGSRALGKNFGIFEDEGVPGDTKKWVAKSFSDEEKFYIFKGKDVFFQTIVRAYADHRPLVLSPDMVWLLISQGFANNCASIRRSSSPCPFTRYGLAAHQSRIRTLRERAP